jgi:hypothetical protein
MISAMILTTNSSMLELVKNFGFSIKPVKDNPAIQIASKLLFEYFPATFPNLSTKTYCTMGVISLKDLTLVRSWSYSSGQSVNY